MVRENDGGAPRVHSELVKLGLEVSESTVSRCLRRSRPRNPAPDVLERWVAFLRNHRDDIAAMDFFTVPTIELRALCVFFVIGHGRRRILHFNATYDPTAQWVIRQLRDAFPFDTAFCADLGGRSASPGSRSRRRAATFAPSRGSGRRRRRGRSRGGRGPARPAPGRSAGG